MFWAKREIRLYSVSNARRSNFFYERKERRKIIFLRKREEDKSNCLMGN